MKKKCEKAKKEVPTKKMAAGGAAKVRLGQMKMQTKEKKNG